MTVDPESLGPLVANWLPTQRWFAGKGREFVASVQPLTELSEAVQLWLARVDYLDGGSHTYQVPLVAYPHPIANLDHVQVGTVETADGPIWIYDALHDKDVTPAWLTGIRDAATRGPLTFTRYVEPDEIPVGQPSLPLNAEQSNTSLMYGDSALLKVFRRLQPGVNPDIEVHAELTALHAQHLARLFGAVHATIDGRQYALAMLQEYLVTATDGWELAKASLRDLMAERDLHAAEAGGDFAAESFRLGAAVAQTHADLADAFGTEAVDAPSSADRAAAMSERLDRAAAQVPGLDALRPQLDPIFAATAGLQSEPPAQRIHGDLHLGQVLRTASGWVLIDFEGEPMADIDARRASGSPLRDVAGMRCSYSYAGYHRSVDVGDVDQQLAYRAEEWIARNRSAFCDGYAEVAGYDPREAEQLLRAFEADKAVYEAVYEASHRPAWLPIPLRSLRRLVEVEATA